MARHEKSKAQTMQSYIKQNSNYAVIHKIKTQTYTQQSGLSRPKQ